MTMAEHMPTNDDDEKNLPSVASDAYVLGRTVAETRRLAFQGDFQSEFTRQLFDAAGIGPGMRVLGSSDGFPELPSCRVGLVRNPHEQSALAEALAEHIISSLDNLSAAADAAE